MAVGRARSLASGSARTRGHPSVARGQGVVSQSDAARPSMCHQILVSRWPPAVLALKQMRRRTPHTPFPIGGDVRHHDRLYAEIAILACSPPMASGQTRRRRTRGWVTNGGSVGSPGDSPSSGESSSLWSLGVQLECSSTRPPGRMDACQGGWAARRGISGAVYPLTRRLNQQESTLVLLQSEHPH